MNILVLGYVTWRLIHFRKDAASGAANVTLPAQTIRLQVNELYAIN